MAELTQKKYLDQAGLSAFWTKVKGYIDGTATNVGNLALEYTDDKKIALKRDGAIISSFDASDFIKDSFVQSGEIVEKEGKQFLRLTLNTVERPGAAVETQTVDIDVDKMFSQNASDIKMADGSKTVEEALSAVITESAKNKTDITALDAAYKAADTALEGKVTTLNGNVADLQAADATLDEKIEGVKTAYQKADADLGGRIDDLDAAYKAADAELDGKISALDTAYKAADTALAGRVKALEDSKDAYVAADTALEDKVTRAYQAADTALETKVTEAYTAADTALKSEIEEAYTAADTTLDGKISALDTAYKAADTAVYEAITAIPTEYINSLFA